MSNESVKTESKDGIEWKIYYLGIQTKFGGEMFAWKFKAKGETFEYFTGLGHGVKRDTIWGSKGKPKEPCIGTQSYWVRIPSIDDLLECIESDASASERSFDDWCGDLGYDTDSRKALETYLSCQEIGQKLRKVKRA